MEKSIVRKDKYIIIVAIIYATIYRLIMGSHKRAIDAYVEAEKISLLPDWEIYHGLGKLFVIRFTTQYICTAH